MKNIIRGNSIITASKSQVSRDAAGKIAILNVKTGRYFGLDEVGALIWSLIQKPRTVNEIRDAILKEYNVNPDQCKRDIVALLTELASQGLIEVRNGNT